MGGVEKWDAVLLFCQLKVNGSVVQDAFVTPCSILKPEYLVFLLGSPYVRSVLIAESVGTTMNNLNHNILGDILIPLPPFNEQIKIMRKYAEAIAPLGV